MSIWGSPHDLRLGSFYTRRQQVQATCSCGRITNVHLGNLIREYGDEAIMNEHMLNRVAKRLNCIRCGRNGPALEVLVEG